MMRILPAPPVKLLGRALPLPPPPLAPVSVLLSRLMRSAIARHPTILRRMGPAAGSRFLIEVTDLPLIFVMEPSLRRLTAYTRWARPEHDTAIRGKLKSFLSMLHAEEDGDALFFSGELEIQGDTGAVLALRNALDDAEIDLTEELATLAGPAGNGLRRLSGMVQKRTGLSLGRKPLDDTETL